MAEGISCQKLTDFIQSYLDGELPKDQIDSFEQHLEMCPPCIHYLESYKTTVELEKACGPGAAAMPEELVKGIVEAMRKQKPDGS